MDDNIKELDRTEKEDRFKRIRRVKKWLRHLPRKTSIHRYPILNRFANVAKKRAYLWSFRVEDVVPSLYAGSVLTLTPFPSFLQILFAFCLALIIQSNAIILTGMQLISNPITFLFLWNITYKVGHLVVTCLGGDTLQAINDTYSFGCNNLGSYGKIVVKWFATTMFGAMILGTIVGFILSMIYKYMAKKSIKRNSNDQKSIFD